jgi:hypothetical protein
MTHTVAYLGIPKAAWDFIADALEEAGYGDHMITEIDGRITVAVPLDGIAVVPVGQSDSFINMRALAELMEEAGRDAFDAGYRAAIRGDRGCDDSWDLYKVPDHIMEMHLKLLKGE